MSRNRFTFHTPFVPPHSSFTTSKASFAGIYNGVYLVFMVTPGARSCTCTTNEKTRCKHATSQQICNFKQVASSTAQLRMPWRRKGLRAELVNSRRQKMQETHLVIRVADNTKVEDTFVTPIFVVSMHMLNADTDEKGITVTLPCPVICCIEVSRHYAESFEWHLIQRSE